VRFPFNFENDLNKCGCMSLEYHQNTFNLLSLKPIVSEELLKLLNDVEHQYSISIPPSIREWYSIKEAMNILKTSILFDVPHPPQEWHNIGQFWLGDRLCNDLLSEGFLLILSENQGVFHWAVKLDGSDDPPVFIEIDSVPNFIWQLYTKRFSEFIYDIVWKFVKKPEQIKLIAYTSITQADLSALTQSFKKLPTLIYPKEEKLYRFRGDSQSIEIREEQGAICVTWCLSAQSPSLLFSLASQIWELGYQLNYLLVPEYDFLANKKNTNEKEVLSQIKLAGKLAKEVSWEEHEQQC
jgi:hypothetical protein